MNRREEGTHLDAESLAANLALYDLLVATDCAEGAVPVLNDVGFMGIYQAPTCYTEPD